jgi:hypothetical protein
MNSFRLTALDADFHQHGDRWQAEGRTLKENIQYPV